jgi:hypothetical protein
MDSVIDKIIGKLFSERWTENLALAPIEDQRKQLFKTLRDQTNGYWSGHTAYHLAVEGGFLIDGKSNTNKQLTELGKIFMESMDSAGQKMKSLPIAIELANAFESLPEVPSLQVLALLRESASVVPGDLPLWEMGKALQQKYGCDVVPPSSEIESAAGLWFFMQQSILSQTARYKNQQYNSCF